MDIYIILLFCLVKINEISHNFKYACNIAIGLYCLQHCQSIQLSNNQTLVRSDLKYRICFVHTFALILFTTGGQLKTTLTLKMFSDQNESCRYIFQKRQLGQFKASFRWMILIIKSAPVFMHRYFVALIIFEQCFLVTHFQESTSYTVYLMRTAVYLTERMCLLIIKYSVCGRLNPQSTLSANMIFRRVVIVVD